MSKNIFSTSKGRLRESLTFEESGATGVHRYSERRLTKKAKCGGHPPHKNISVFDFANITNILRYAKTINTFAVRGFIDSLKWRSSPPFFTLTKPLVVATLKEEIPRGTAMKKEKKKSKNKLLRVLTAFIVIIAALFAVWYYNTFTLKVTHTTIESEKIEDSVKIVQISDLHGAAFGKDNITLIKKIEKQNPDFIVATGDMYSFHDEKGEETAVKLLTSLAKNNKVYFVNGEHDYNFNGDDYTQALAEGGVEIMDYETAEISVGTTKLVLYGISNVTYSSTFDLANEFTVDKSKFNVLIAHIENFKKFSDFGIDLSICGDTHGGQVRLPFVGAVQNQGIWFPELSGVEEAAYTKGLYEKNGSYLFISSGLGNYPVPIRFMNRPEIAVIELKSK